MSLGFTMVCLAPNSKSALADNRTAVWEFYFSKFIELEAR